MGKSFVIGIGAGISIFLVFLLSFFSYQFQKRLSFEGNQKFRVIPGQGLKEISQALQSAGLVKSPLPFYWYAKLHKKERILQAGLYKISGNMGVAELASLFEKGSNVFINITIPEGFTIKQIVNRLEEKGLAINEDDFLTISEEMRASYPFLQSAPRAASLEGFLFPDTYRFPVDASFSEIVQDFLHNFQKQVNSDLMQAIIQTNHSPYEVLIMASILERELQTFEDKSIAAGILWRRLALGIPLGVDATVNYVTGKKTPALSEADMALDSYYNTYKYTGLPPGPISNPGLESIKAALFPKENEYWFYLSRQDNGQTIFSKTLQEHNQAKVKYLR